MALVQSVNDSRRAWRNFFDSVAGRRRGPRVGRPRMKSRKDHRQSFRLTRNGLSVRDTGQLFLAKVGEVRALWSRQLRSEPSSVTIIREPDGHHCASFVVNVEPSPRPMIDRQAGVDLGLSRLATVAGTDGKRADIANHVEDLNIAGMVANRRLARAIGDAGWGQFVRIIAEKADRYGRTLNTVSRWPASSKTCSTCGHRLDELPLQVREPVAAVGVEAGSNPTAA